MDRAAAALAVLILIAGCGSQGAPADDALCIRRPITGVLHIDSDDPRAVWATGLATGRTISLRLPSGYGVTPDDEVVDPDGHAIATNGDTIVGGCADLMQDALLITESDIRREPSS